MEALNTKAIGTNMVYDKIAKVSPEAALAMQQFKDYSAQANKAFRAYGGSQIKLPAALDEAKALQAEADAAADLLRGELKAQRAGNLWDEFQDSRKLRAQIELAKEAISPGGKINADTFGNAFELGRPLTGKFAKIGRVQSEFSRYFSQFPPTPSGGVSSMVRQAVGAPVRAAILSRPGQNAFNTPFYGPTNEDFQATLGRLGIMAGGRNVTTSTNKNKN